MKQNFSETKSNWRFRKKLKTCLQNKKSYLMPPSRHGHFHMILILPVKMVELPVEFLISLLDDCYHYLVFMDPVNGCSNSKLLVKE